MEESEIRSVLEKAEEFVGNDPEDIAVLLSQSGIDSGKIDNVYHDLYGGDLI
jgi:hypothetical protein